MQEAVDDGVDAAVAHGQPVYRRVDDDKEVFLRDGFVLGQLRLKVDEKNECVQREPADGEQRHNDDQHLYHLFHRHTTHSYRQQPAPLSKLSK